MRYFVEDIEDQILATLHAVSGLDSVVQIDVNTAVVPQMFTDPGYVKNLIPQLPFVYLQYMGRSTGMMDLDAAAQQYVHQLKFRFFCGAQNLRAVKDAQRGTYGAYGLLRTVFDAIHGRMPIPNTSPAPIVPLSGVPSITSGFSPFSPLKEAGGSDEQLVVNLPGNIVVYQTDYVVRMIA